MPLQASALEQAGAARRLGANPLDVHELAQAMAEFVTSPGRLVLMREAAERLARPGAAEDVLEHCRASLEGRAARLHAETRDEEEATCSVG